MCIETEHVLCTYSSARTFLLSIKCQFALDKVLFTTPVILRFCHSVSTRYTLVPILLCVGSSVSIKFGIVKEFACLRYIFLVIVFPLRAVPLANSFVLCLG